MIFLILFATCCFSYWLFHPTNFSPLVYWLALFDFDIFRSTRPLKWTSVFRSVVSQSNSAKVATKISSLSGSNGFSLSDIRFSRLEVMEVASCMIVSCNTKMDRYFSILVGGKSPILLRDLQILTLCGVWFQLPLGLDVSFPSDIIQIRFIRVSHSYIFFIQTIQSPKWRDCCSFLH